MDYAGFLTAQRQALLDEWLGLNNPSRTPDAFIALPDISWVEKLTRPEYFFGGGHWSPLPGAAPTEAMVRHDRAGRRQLWVRPEDKAGGSGRYAAYWRSFAAAQGFAEAPSELQGRPLAVDHLFPETAAARRGWLLVRVMPVDRRSNSLIGSTIEKVEAGRGGVHRPRHATAATMAKVTGFQGSFARRNDPAAIAAALLAHLRGCGLHVPDGILLDEVEAGMITGLIGHYRR